MTLPKILILYTGGTIGMAPRDPDNPSSPLEPKSLNELIRYIPFIEELEKKITLDYISLFDPPLDSSDIIPDHWIRIAKEVKKAEESNDYNGYVILHGTDTMAYTSSALSFIFHNLKKPVVVTGSQLPISDPRTDGVLNFTNAIYIAGHKAFKLPKIPEVVICFSKYILRGNRATKVSSNGITGFDSPNFPPLGIIGEYIDINEKIILNLPPRDNKLTLNDNLNDKIMSITLFPGFGFSHLHRFIESDDSGIILNTFGAGNAPNNIKFLDLIEQISNTDKIILNITQCLRGEVEMGLYAASSGLLERGVISGLDMTREAAIAKLMYLLGSQSIENTKIQLQLNQRGEQSHNLFDLRFGAINEANPTNKVVVDKQPDNRFLISDMHKAVLRISNLIFTNVNIGETVKLNIFMNHFKAENDTSIDTDKCVLSLDLEWNGTPLNPINDIFEKARHVISDSPINLTIVTANKSYKFHYDGLYLALFTKVN